MIDRIKSALILNVFLLMAFFGSSVYSQQIPCGFKINKLIYEDNFAKLSESYIIETPGQKNSKVSVRDNKLVVDVAAGATIWLNKKLSGNYLLEYKRKVIIKNGTNDRLSDFNQFWMASDPKKPNIFGRKGVFEDYDSLSLYYIGMGGNTNKTTRFRKYYGDGTKPLIKEYTDQEHLLEPNKEYSIILIVKNGLTEYYVDGKKYFSFKDEKPLREGYFGFRTTASHQEISDFKIFSLK